MIQKDIKNILQYNKNPVNKNNNTKHRIHLYNVQVSKTNIFVRAY